MLFLPLHYIIFLTLLHTACAVEPFNDIPIQTVTLCLLFIAIALLAGTVFDVCEVHLCLCSIIVKWVIAS